MKNKLLKPCIVFIVLILLISMPAYSDTKNVDKESEIESKDNYQHKKQKGTTMPENISKSNEEWRQQLTPEQYRITRERGTEPPFTGKYYSLKDKGIYQCICCGNELFSSDTKYDSGSGWPSFWSSMSEKNIKKKKDHSLGMVRTEVMCSVCDAHLGHVFDDGPPPTMLRYCVNSAALKFIKKEE